MHDKYWSGIPRSCRPNLQSRAKIIILKQKHFFMLMSQFHVILGHARWAFMSP